ncbi:DNA polymerase III subunit epsilon [Corynebacterium sp. HMSC036E10]|uniref:exonuclease domain-containing protein n=1 Tax=Corynebacterium sp. HMSC036E10 TaxID=1715215 RepID=UPI0008A99BD1|nr:exonuclease domain-containing protein [Corynebacterium sp. HMSC036E10]OHO81821.1 DNA polymerase III subunit epsilon [Corynebacterium sp. HMSC036E10]
MISAHGATLTVTNDALTVTPTALLASLRGDSSDRTVSIADITGVDITEGDAWSPTKVDVATTGAPLTVWFAPGDVDGAKKLRTLLDDAKHGKAPTTATADGGAGIPGFSFVGFDVETANRRWGSICQIGLVKIVDGEEVERKSWLCKPPAGLDEFESGNVAIHGISAEDVTDAPDVRDCIEEMSAFVGDLPLVAHNAQFDASALRDACLASSIAVPKMLFACTLAQARATKLDVANHKLPTLAQHFGVSLDNHHDACEDAAACAGVMVGLAREAGHTGSLMSFIHDTGFTLGSIDDARVTPVLRDRSGAGRAVQAKQVAEGGVAAAVAATAEPRGSNQAGPVKKERKPAPWQSVATPDTVPEPDAQADPNAPLYGEHVTLTGEFEPHDKGELWDAIAKQGAQVGKNVTKKTTILVVGEWSSVTSKEKRARELQEKGQDIQIWQAPKLLEVLGL